MMRRERKMPGEGSGEYPLFLIVFFFFLLFLQKIRLLSGFLVLFFLLFFFIQIVGDKVKFDRMNLRNLELGFAFGTAEDLALFDFVLIDIDFGGTFRAADHGSILRRVLHAAGVTNLATATVRRIIYRVG
jgi:hypothetical protein